MVTPAQAQQDGPAVQPIPFDGPVPELEVTQEAEEHMTMEAQGRLKDFLREEVAPQKARKMLREMPQIVRPKKVGGVQPKAIGGVPETGQDQSWALNQNPNTRLNMDLIGTPERAGDINGDGSEDYLYERGFSSGRDERTSALEDYTGKSAVFFGKAPSNGQTEDQFIYESLRPVGDINDDGYDDAVAGDGTLYLGGDDGYAESEEEVSIFGRQVSASRDFNGDGIDDALFGRFFGDSFFILYGAEQIDDVTAEFVSATESEELANYNAGDTDGDGEDEVVRHVTVDGNTVMEIFEVSPGDSSVQPTQQFGTGLIPSLPYIWKPAIVDVNGDDTNEIIPVDLFSIFESNTLVFDSDSDGVFAPDPISWDVNATPVGDLEGDGNQDFFTRDPESADLFRNQTRYISYGPDNLSDGISFDTEIPYGESTRGRVNVSYYGGNLGQFGDLTGDGRLNTVLSVRDETPSDRRVGRRFVSVDQDTRPAEAQVTDATYPKGHFLDQVVSVEEVGDFNDDNLPDFAMVREDLSRLEIFSGGSSISSSPDQTIEAPSSSLYQSVTSGDFNGDGTPDIAAGYNDGSQIDVYFGGSDAGGSPDHVIDTSDTEASRLYAVQSVGDVNDNGADDLLATNRGTGDTTQVSLFFGGSSLPSTADQMIEYPDFRAGVQAVSLGDVNGDEIGDFAVGRQRLDSRRGGVDVFYGGDDPSFSGDNPNVAIRPETQVEGFGGQLAAGDFTGNGETDLAVSAVFTSGAPISVFQWDGTGADAVVDQTLNVQVAAGPVEEGVLETVSDADGDGADELVLGSANSGATNAVLYQPSEQDDPVRVLRAPNQNEELGGGSVSLGSGRIATGDFTDDGNADLVLTQPFDNNDAWQSSRVYRFGIDQLTRSSEVVYVDRSADSTEATDGESWETAYVDLQTAIDDAAAIDEIWVAEGTYKPNPDFEGDRSATFEITGAWDGLEIYGGFTGEETVRDQRDPDANGVVLSGDLGVEEDTSDNAYHVVTLDGTTPDGPITEETVIDGFTITDGNASGDFPDERGGGLVCDGSESGNECSATLRNLQFQDNTASVSGGAVINSGFDGGTGSPTLVNVTFMNNEADFGGGVYNDGSNGTSSPTIRNATFQNNTAYVAGGAVYIAGPFGGAANPFLEEVTFIENGVEEGPGGAMYVWGAGSESSTSIAAASAGKGETKFERASAPAQLGSATGGGTPSISSGVRAPSKQERQSIEANPTIRNATFENNSGTFGGAILNNGINGGNASPQIENSLFRGNQSTLSGGALYNFGSNGTSSPTIRGSKFLKNEAASDGEAGAGGAIANDGTSGGTSAPSIVNTVFLGNTAAGGGAMVNFGFSEGTVSPKITNSTFAGNEVLVIDGDESGGAIQNLASSDGQAQPEIENTILWSNTAPTSPTIFNDTSTADPEFSHTILEGSGGSGSGWVDSLGTDNGGNLDQDPYFAAAAGPDGEWGTEDDDVRLQGPGSPVGASSAIDAGDNGALPSDLSEDLGGEARRQDVEDVEDTGSGTAPIVDIGAYESDGSAQVEYVSESQEVDGDGTYEYSRSGFVFGFSGTSNSGTVTAERFGSAPTDVTGITGRLLDARLVVSAEGDLTFESTEVGIDVSTLSIEVDPDKIIMYRRGTVGDGEFMALETTYDADAGEISAEVTELGEFVLVIDAPAAPSSLASTLSEGEVEVSWEAPDGSDVAEYNVYRALSPIDELSDLSPIGTVESTSYADTDVEEGTTHYYRVTAVDADGIEGAVSDQIRVFFYPQRVTANVSRSFDDASEASDYRLVALPGRADTSLADAVSGEAGAQWQAYWDDGSDSDFLVKFGEADEETFTFEAGNGFWLTSQQTWTSDAEFPAVELEGDTAAVVDLRDGWNVVSNPLDKDLSFVAIDAVNDGVLQPFWSFEGGSFGSPDTVESARSGKAYYFFNDEGLDALRIPYPGAPGGKAAPKDVSSETGPMLALSASTMDEGPTSTVQIGLADTERSVVAPPGRFEAVSLRIEAEEAPSKRTRTLMAERRTLEGEGETFPLRLTSQADGPVELTVGGLNAVEGQEVRLLVHSDGESHDLRREETVTLEPEGEATNLKLAVGSESYVESEASEVVPKEVRLTSYPNPVRQQGTLEYALPEQANVTIRVYDVLGRQVATLQQGQKKAGRHTVRLKTDRLSSGVYFGRLQAGGQTLTQKITVVR